MKRSVPLLVGLLIAGSVTVGCGSAGGDVSEGGAMSKHAEIEKQTAAAQGDKPQTTEQGQGD